MAVSCVSAVTGNENEDSQNGNEESCCSKWEETWIVASSTTHTPDFPIVWWIKRNGSEEWTLQYPPFVDGFNYEEGYEYVLLVQAIAQDLDTVDADTPSVLYSLIKVLAKEKKESEGIPR